MHSTTGLPFPAARRLRALAQEVAPARAAAQAQAEVGDKYAQFGGSAIDIPVKKKDPQNSHQCRRLDLRRVHAEFLSF